MSRFHQPVRRRLPVPLTSADGAGLAELLADDRSRAALEALSGAPVAGASPSEAALLHALVEVGWQRLRDEVEAAGYAELAALRAVEPGDRRAEARRRRPAWATEG